MEYSAGKGMVGYPAAGELICQNGLYKRFIEIREKTEGWRILSE